MKRIEILILSLFMVGCSLWPSETPKPAIEYPETLRRANEFISEKKFENAERLIEDYLNEASNIHWYGHAYFLKGFVFELKNEPSKAIKQYRAAIDHGSSYNSKISAKALYNLSFVYEQMDERQKLLATLIDLMKKRQYFDPLTAKVEIPARLAAAYGGLGRMKEALIFHREGAQNFNSLVRNGGFKAPQTELAKSLYYLGFAVFDQNQNNYDHLIRKLSVGQRYFLAAAEASKSEWSGKARERLDSQYNQAWGMVQSYKPKGFKNDPMAFKKNQQIQQLEMAAQLYDLMYRLRAEEFPLTNVNRNSKAIMDRSGRWIEKIEKFTLKLSLGPETIRSKKVKNTRLARYVEEKKAPVRINKESVAKKKQAPTEFAPSTTQETKSLPEKGQSSESSDIGDDPNLMP